MRCFWEYARWDSPGPVRSGYSIGGSASAAPARPRRPSCSAPACTLPSLEPYKRECEPTHIMLPRVCLSSAIFPCWLRATVVAPPSPYHWLDLLGGLPAPFYT